MNTFCQIEYVSSDSDLRDGRVPCFVYSFIDIHRTLRIWSSNSRWRHRSAIFAPSVCYPPAQMAFQPMPLSRRPLPFDHPEWIFELKYDGFRSLAVIQNGRTQLISRNGNPFNSFADLCKGLTLPLSGKTVLDGEIVCLDKRGRPQFSDLLFHRGEHCFYAFDLLMYDGKDIRSERLTDRKHELRRLLTGLPTDAM